MTQKIVIKIVIVTTIIIVVQPYGRGRRYYDIFDGVFDEFLDAFDESIIG
jgi:hypothetical protein